VAEVDRERLEPRALDAARFQAGLLESLGSVFGGEVNALGLDAAALASVRGEEGDVGPHPRFGGIVGGAERKRESQGDEKQEGQKSAARHGRLLGGWKKSMAILAMGSRKMETKCSTVW